MKKHFPVIGIILILSLVSGCGLLVPPTPPPTLPPVPTIAVFPTEIPIPTSLPTKTQVVLPTLEPTTMPTPQPKSLLLIQAVTMFDNYLLRTGPGRLFERIEMYASGYPLQIVAREAGNNWVLVITSDHRGGWMNIVGLQYEGDIITLPVITVTGAVILHGHVWNVDKSPAELIGVSLQPEHNTNPNYQEHVMTGPDGAWYAYLPPNTSGYWVVGPDSYGCPKDVPTGQCSLTGTLPPPQTIGLPQLADVNIEFDIVP